ncbi:hypothetical protein [uncultured Maribacter sp.]|uniref:hypothetical protein n=1 Tax=uncultured Maribacter sp. TaxID=431308 RepID=UPI00260642F9|nr:hypothetical protein [uncultured Maribacter sp.]
MNQKLTILFSFLFLSICNLTAQYDIVYPKSESIRNQHCKDCFSAFQQKPKEVSFSIKREGDNLYFVTNDKKWFQLLFKNPTDGIAVDIVDKERYDCDMIFPESTQIKGEVLKPVYAERLKKSLKPYDRDKFRVLVGKLPSSLIGKELEYNILFLGNKNLCNYYTIYNLKSYGFDLLDMGMYLDSIQYNDKKVASLEEGYKIKYKTLRFKIPFQKNKSQYIAEDIKPLYDSLRLTDFNIKTIDIKAYSSIEGSLERNLELQKQRANSIANALQSYQTPVIKTTISTSENWVEFLNDIEGTKYNSLKNLNKQELKSKLVGGFSAEMEPILKNHRKAVITLSLEKKDKYKKMKAEELVNVFNTELKAGNLEEATKIQNSLFNKLKYLEGSPDLLRKMEVPEQLSYVRFLNNRSIFKYELSDKQLLIVNNELEKLLKLDPKNSRVKYNLAVLKFKIWRYNAQPVDENKFKNEIMELKNYGISQSLINRMLVNYHIIKSERYMRKRDYENKDKSVAYINDNYKKIPLRDIDYFNLAQFLTYYANTDRAANLLIDKARSIDVNEDLLFYYINLTVVDEDLTQTDDYRAIMLNAINLNKSRYCELFSSPEKDGITFQLLEDEYLRDTYCENCK